MRDSLFPWQGSRNLAGVKVRGESFKRERWGNFFIQKMMGLDNKLPEEVEQVGTVTILKRHLDKYLNRNDLKRYSPGADQWAMSVFMENWYLY